MRVNSKVGEIEITAAGVVFAEEDWNLGNEQDKQYKNFSKAELFCGAYQRIILPSRRAMGIVDEPSFRLYYIYDEADTLVFYFHFDDSDEAYIRLDNAVDLSLDEVMSKLVDALKNALPDDEMSESFVCDNSIDVTVPEEEEVIEFLKKTVFYDSDVFI